MYFKILISLLVAVLSTSCASVGSSYRMAVTDFSGNARPFYIAGEALNLMVYWNAKSDVGKPVDCIVSDTFSGKQVWRGVLVIPEAKSGQLITNAVWNPPFPSDGLKLDSGSYVAVCNFNNEAKASIPLNIIKVK